MATYFVASGGSNTAPYDTWAKAATSLQTALTAAAAAGDIVVLQYNGVPSGDAEVGADTTYTFAANILLVTASNDGGSAYTATAQGTGTWVGNSTTNRSVTLTGAFAVRIWGLTIRTAGSVNDSIVIGAADGSHFELEGCYLWQGNTNGSGVISLGNITPSASQNCFTRLIDTTLRFGSTSQSLNIAGKAEIFGGSVSSAGSAPTTFVRWAANSTSAEFHGCDLSHLGSGTLVGSAGNSPGEAWFVQCKFGASYVVLAAQTPANRSSSCAYVLDCSSGDTHGLNEYHDAFGSLVSNTSIYFTSGVAAQSWKITTTANCSFNTPFVTPWIPYYNSALSAVTPYIEILRDGSTTAYTDGEVWAEFSAKVTSGSTQATLSNDRRGIVSAAANQAAGAGLSEWTGESGTAWSGKCGLGSSITPAEVGDICGRICVGLASIAGTLYVDPFVRT